MIRILIGILIGAAAGGALGYFGSCSTGTCPFTSTWWGGALFGGVVGMFLAQSLPLGKSMKTPPDLTNVKDITTRAAFDAAVAEAGARTVLVDFYATTCPPCRRLMPVLHQLARERGAALMLIKINAGASAELSRQYEVQAVPTLLLLRNGALLARTTGYQSLDQLRAWTQGTP